MERVISCVQTVSYSFVQDRNEFGNIQPKRGIRKGDPMSPYLYILCAEGLSSIIRRNEEAGLVHGCCVARGEPPISHLIFADDCYMFFKAITQEARSMKGILERYENLSVQKINFTKSTVRIVQIQEILAGKKYALYCRYRKQRYQESIWGCQCILAGEKIFLSSS